MVCGQENASTPCSVAFWAIFRPKSRSENAPIVYVSLEKHLIM
jgi:hypothetical protein